MNYFSKTKPLSIFIVITLLSSIFILPPSFSFADTPKFQVSRVSVNSSNQSALGDSSDASISADGRYVVFSSPANNLLPGDDEGNFHIYRKDITTGAIVRVSEVSSSIQGDGNSTKPSISADGRYVAFSSEASNLVLGDTNNASDIFRKDMLFGSITRVSVDSLGGQANNFSDAPSISADGQFVAFRSWATNLDVAYTDTANTWDIFRKDIQAGTMVRVSVNSANTQTPGVNSYYSSISSDGRFVAFSSQISNLVTGDINNSWDIFRKDLVTNTILRVSTSSTDAGGNSNSESPSISSDGRFVAFTSGANNLIPEVTNDKLHIYRKDLETKAIVKVTTDSLGTQGDDISYDPSISGNGRFVAFRSYATNLIPGDINNKGDIFRKDLQTGITTIASINLSNVQADNTSENPSISSDGRFIAFSSFATNLIVGDANSSTDIFLAHYNSAPVLNFIGNKTAELGQAIQFNLAANDIDADALTYSATNLPPGALLNSLTGVFSWTPNNNQTGIYPVHFQVSDGSLTDSEDITLTVPALQQTILSTILSIKATPKVIVKGKATTVKGQLKDSSGKPVAGKKVALQAKVLKITKKKVKGKIKLVKKWIWKTVASLTTNSQGNFSKKLKPKNTTSYRAVFGKDTSYNAANSKTVKVIVNKIKKNK